MSLKPAMRSPIQAIFKNSNLQGTVSGGGVLAPLKFASPNNAWPVSTQLTATGTQLTMRIRWAVVLGSGDAPSIAITFSGRVATISGDVPLGNDYTVSKLAVGLDGTSIGVAVNFSGSRSKIVTNGTYLVDSDDLPYTAFASTLALGKFPRGQVVWVQCDLTVASAGMFFPCSQTQYATVANALAVTLDPATFTGSFDVDNFSTRTLGSASFWTNRPAIFTPLLCARFSGTEPVTLGGYGDSLMGGANDGGSNIGTAGSFQRSLMNAFGDANPIGGIRIGVSGAVQSNFVTQALINALGPRTKYMFYGFGANNWVTLPGTSVASNQTLLTTMLGWWYASDLTKPVRSVLARKVTPRCVSSHSSSSATNVTTAATITSADGLVPGNGTSVTLSGFTPAAYNGTFTVTGVAGSTFNVTLGSDPGGSATVQGLWNDNGVTSSSLAYLNNCWGPVGTDPAGRARNWNDALDTMVGDSALLSALALASNRASATQSADGFYLWKTQTPSVCNGDTAGVGAQTHPSAASYQVEAGDMRTAFTALT